MRISGGRPALSGLWATMVCGGTLFLVSCLSGHAARNMEVADFHDVFLNEDYRGESANDTLRHTQDAQQEYLREKRVMQLAGRAAGGLGALGLFLGFLAPILYVKGVKQSLAPSGPPPPRSDWIKVQEATLGERALDALRPADKNWYNAFSKGTAGLGALLVLSSLCMTLVALRARSRSKANRMDYRRLPVRLGLKGGVAESDETERDFDLESVGGQVRGPRVIAGQRRTSGFYPRIQMRNRPAGGLAASLSGIVERPMDHEWPSQGWRHASGYGPDWPSQAEKEGSVSKDE